MAYRPHDIKALRQTFADSASDITVSAEIDADDLHIKIEILGDGIKYVLAVPYGEDEIMTIVMNNAAIKRWKVELKEAERLMRRAAAGERNTEYLDHRMVGGRLNP